MHWFENKVFDIIDARCNMKYTHFVFNNFPHPQNRAVHEIMWKNIVEWGRPQMTVWRMRIICWIIKAINTLSECIILTAFSQPQ
jgi:hypothetical protein